MDPNLDAILRHVGELYLKSKMDLEHERLLSKERIAQIEAQLQTANDQVIRLTKENHRLSEAAKP